MGSPRWRAKPCSQSLRASSRWPELKAAVARRTISSALCLFMSCTLEQRNESAKKVSQDSAFAFLFPRCHRPRKRTIQYSTLSRFYLRRRRLLDARFRGHDSALLRRAQRFAQDAIVGVALGTAAVERRLVRRVERRAALQALDQVGGGAGRFSERDQIGRVGDEHLVGEFEIIAVVGDIGPFEALAQGAVVERRDVARAAGRAFDDVDVDQF